MTDQPSIAEITSPGFCPWCGTPSVYREEPHTPLWSRLAEEHHTTAPEVIQENLHTDAYATGCPGCRRVSHVIGHHPPRG